MSAGNRKYPYRPATASPQEQNRRFTYLVALVAAAGLVIGLIFTGGPAKAADTVEETIAQLHHELDKLQGKVETIKDQRDASDKYAQCLKQENRYLKQVLRGDKNYYAQEVCKR